MTRPQLIFLNLAHYHLGKIDQQVARFGIKSPRFGINGTEGAQSVPFRRDQRCSSIEADMWGSRH